METKKLEKRSDISINGSVATYTFSYQSETRGTLLGQFTFKCILLPMDKLAVGRERRQLLGEFEALASELERYIAYSLSELKYRIITAPVFWNDDKMNGNIPEEQLLFNVLDAALYAQGMYSQTKNEEKDALVNSALKQAEKILTDKKEENDKEDKDDLDDELDDEG